MLSIVLRLSNIHTVQQQSLKILKFAGAEKNTKSLKETKTNAG